MMTNKDLEQLITKYGKDIYSFCIHLTGNCDLADELYQETFLVATRRRRALPAIDEAKGYLLSVAVHIWTNMKRKFARRSLIAPVSSYEETMEMTAPDDTQATVLKTECCQSVHQAVSALPEKLRIVVLLHYMEELSIKQISVALHIPEGTVKSRLSNARKILAEELEEWIDE